MNMSFKKLGMSISNVGSVCGAALCFCVGLVCCLGCVACWLRCAYIVTVRPAWTAQHASSLKEIAFAWWASGSVHLALALVLAACMTLYNERG